IVALSLERIVYHIHNIAETFELEVQNAVRDFSERAGPALALWKEAVDAIKATIGVVAISPQEAEAVVAGIVLFVNALIAGLGEISDSDQLDKAVDLATSVVPVAAALKAWADAAAQVRGYTLIAAEAWDAIKTDFSRGLTLIRLMILDAREYLEDSILFKSLIDQGSD